MSALAVVALLLSFSSFHEIYILIGCATVYFLFTKGFRSLLVQKSVLPIFLSGDFLHQGSYVTGVLALPVIATNVPDLNSLFLSFLKIGSVLFGSGYVLFAFLRSEFVERFHWVSDTQLIDAVTIGQLTPGPVFTAATFVGFLISGMEGAIVATAGIFLPAFIFVAISAPLICRLRSSKNFSILLDGLNIASFFGVSLILIQNYRVNSVWLIIGGGCVGYFFL